MNDFSVRKIIRASAGTGKTYRLSLEYICLLVKFAKHGLHFSEILVITFTKKATAEIRQRIFEQLDDIIQQNESGKQLSAQLQSIFDLSLGEPELKQLKATYREMLTNKSNVLISTIDSFTHTIFKTIIAPYLGITDFVIDPQMNEPIIEELYRGLVEDSSNLERFRSFFERSGLKKINDYERLIKSIISNRWVFTLARQGAKRRLQPAPDAPDHLYSRWKDAFLDLVGELKHYVETEHPTKSLKELFKSDYIDLLRGVDYKVRPSNFEQAFASLVGLKDIVHDNLSLLLNEGNSMWNGSKLLRKKDEIPLKEHFTEKFLSTQCILADYVFVDFLLREEQDLEAVITDVLQQYDDLKFRDKIFTHSDISYYTFRYLYDPELSLVDGDYVNNMFYEYLSSAIRFVLIDEFQDTSIIQYKILLPIIEEVISGAGVKSYGGTIVVGDEKQAIYGWRGGERDLLLHMSNVLSDATNVLLDTSYRSDEVIISFINRIFEHPDLHKQLSERNIEWPYQPIKAKKQNGKGYIDFYLRNYSSSRNSQNNIRSEEQAFHEYLERTLKDLLKRRQLSITNTAILARRNKDLDAIASALDELGIRYILESSNSILDHRIVKPVYLFMQFLVYGDFYDLLRFTRSDAVLIDTESLKQLMLTYRDFSKETWDIRMLLQRCANIPAVKKVLDVLNSLDSTEPFDVVKKIAEAYDLTGHFPLENDIKNLHHFLLLASEFMTGDREFSKSLKGFLDYCEEDRDSETFKQVGLEELQAVNLMTIHKAKGLEFDTVFLFWDVSAGPGQKSGEFTHYLQYSKDYRTIKSHLYTYNYDKIMRQSSWKAFYQEQEKRDTIETINTMYVALTRAKSNIFMCFIYNKSEGFEKALSSSKENPKIEMIFIDQMRNVFDEKNQYFKYDVNRQRGYWGEIVGMPQATEDHREPSNDHLKECLNSFRRRTPDRERLKREEYVDYKSLFIENNAVEIGNIAHYYLSFIKYGSQQEKKSARSWTITHFGGLISPSTIHSILDQLDEFIERQGDIFSDRWSVVFNEHTLFATDGRELRLDRIMVDKNEKRIEIIDYKTGHIFEPEQIGLYVETVRSLPFVKQQGYIVNGRFVEVNLNRDG